jgi:predicted nucleotidyltransferase
MELEALKKALAADPQVRLAYLFGSQVHGQPGPSSDVDLAVLLERSPSWEEEQDLRRSLAGLVRRLDVVILNDAPPVLRYEVVTAGRCLLVRDSREQAEFEIHALSRFQDIQPFRRVQQRYLQARLEARRGAPHRSSP